MTAGAPAAAHGPGRFDRLFYLGMSVCIAVVVFVGFAPTYYLRASLSTEALPLHLHVHGLLFSAWIGLLVVQTWLVAMRRTSWHRALGWGGAVLAALVAAAGTTAGIMTARREAAAGLEDAARAFLTIPILSILVFSGLVAAAVIARGRAQAHKRLMLLATLSILDAPIARWPGAPGALGVFVLVDLFVAVAILYDVVSRRRVHPAYLWGGAIIVAGQALRDPIGHLAAWHAVARALIG
jgi:hypothetical protein